MKVVFVLPQWWLRPVGGYAVVFGHADGLVRRGHEAHVLIGRPPPGALADELARRERVGAPLVDWRPTDPRVRFHVVEQVDDDAAPDADAVVATATSTVAPVVALAAAKGRKHQLVQGHETWMAAPEELARAWAAPTSKLVVSRWLMEVARGYGVEPRLVPSAVDHHRFGLSTPSAERAPHVLTLFHHAPIKGWMEARAALEHLHTRRPLVAITVFGTPPPPPDLPSWAAYRRDPPDLPDLYDAASIFLSPSRSEGFGLTGAEALASGCALVTTASGGVADYAEPGVTALTSPPGDADALSANLLHMIDDRDLRLRTAAAGRERVAAFTWARASSALEIALLDNCTP